jgi:murein DD-endopeptidase MepM/ murein hydrolase activator NlpD
MRHAGFSLCAAVVLTMTASLPADNSQGLYRIPYANGTAVRVLQDDLTHTPTNRIDLAGTGGTGLYRIVAAGDGIIRYIVDTNTINCTTNGCDAFNNYVWIEHPNGEWTKYSHMRTGTTRGAARLSVGDYVCAGTYLGDEGNIGFATGQHLHFEVAIPNSLRDPIDPVGGFIKGVNVVPRICGIPNNAFVKGDTNIAEPCPTTELSRGVYRIPFANGTEVKVTGDHITHANVPNRIDLVGVNGRPPYRIVAAADGIVRYIVDTNTITCTTNGCAAFNNYVWIEHPNGEWTKYTHMQTGTPSGAAGLFVGKQVCAGTYLGDEDDVGSATGMHLHFEVGVPDDLTDPIQTSGGFIKGENRIPVICGIPGNIFVDGQTYTAAPCSAISCPDNLVLGVQAVHGAKVFMAGDQIDSSGNTFIITSCGSVTLRAGNRITLRPGFRSAANSFLQAVIRDCNEMPGLPGCTIILPGPVADANR